MPPVEDLENPNYKFATEVFPMTVRFWELIHTVRKTVFMWATRIYPLMLSMH